MTFFFSLFSCPSFRIPFLLNASEKILRRIRNVFPDLFGHPLQILPLWMRRQKLVPVAMPPETEARQLLK
jgi:hypothetical protein